ncbi:Cation-independent mannose-6-phosphate receptor CI-MPR [Entomophthora muscae]|uniref:Cation-independent mannose-6-phosphate receptor CI-MPR n=1 Tax=Entomophthora muscae TaxID=34485 RepID=A0ACC2UPQ0_9FUNG|nr:Cation-independent mannose-6-phosphate receptor CI-MPR [Entomophthora muscae]
MLPQGFQVVTGILFLLLACARADEPPKATYCSVHNTTTNDFYDLSSLIKKSGSENYKIFSIETQPKKQNRTFQLNVCEPLATPPKGITVGSTVAVSLLGSDGNEISLGKNSSTPILREGSLVLTYSEGAACKSDPKRKRSTKIIFTCIDSLISKLPTFAGDFDDCEYVFEWKTPAACPISETNLSAGTIIFRFFCIAVFFYLLIGILYKRFVRNAQGLEQIPNFDFWFGIYDFIKDMTLIIAVKVWDTLSSCRSRPSQYSSVPRGDMNSLTIDDDDDDDL